MIKDEPFSPAPDSLSGEESFKPAPKPKSGRASGFAQRRADNLRANLLKRKEQSRARDAVTTSTPAGE
jgi:hypothetical protein